MQTTGSIPTTDLDWASLVLVIIGAINRGLVGIGSLMGANWNLVNLVFAGFPTVEALVYVVVGLAAATSYTSRTGSMVPAPAG